MGLIDTLLGRTTNRPDYLAGPLDIVSPWTEEGGLTTIVWTEALGLDASQLPLTRAGAIGIPAVSKARNLLVATIAKFPLVALRRNADGTDTDVTADHPFLFRTNDAVSPYERMVWTIDDAIMYGVSLWLTERGAAETGGRKPIVNAARCPRDWWKIEGGRILVNREGAGTWQALQADDGILINFPFEGLLYVAQRTLRGALATERAWVGRAVSPLPLVDLHRTDDTAMTPEEVTDMVQAWASARSDPYGAVGSTPENVQMNVLGDVKVELAVEGRNAIRTDIGSFLNVRAAMLDGTIGVDSLTYSTKEGERNAFYEFDLPFWTDPIEARFSLDDMVPRGTRIAFRKYSADNPENQSGPQRED